MITKSHLYALSLAIASAATLPAETLQPTFEPGQDPKPRMAVWRLVEALSDEFAGDQIDHTKWQDEPVANRWGSHLCPSLETLRLKLRSVVPAYRRIAFALSTRSHDFGFI